MNKTVLLTGATDGIGLETAKTLVKNGHNLLLHGRSKSKAETVKASLLSINPNTKIDIYIADLSSLVEVENMAKSILQAGHKIDVIINNAGIFASNTGLGENGLDIRFVVNTIAPYLLTKRLLPILNGGARIVNLSSAAQMPIDWEALVDGGELDASAAYAQSKLALTMWSMELAKALGKQAVVVAVNPKSFLGSKMVKEAYGRQGYDLKIGADILYKAAFSDEFARASGKYYDNDYEQFTSPHPFAMSEPNRAKLMQILENFSN